MISNYKDNRDNIYKRNMVVIQVIQTESIEREKVNGNDNLDELKEMLKLELAKIHSNEKEIMSQALGRLDSSPELFPFENLYLFDCKRLLDLITGDDKEIRQLALSISIKIFNQSPESASIFMQSGIVQDILDFYPHHWVLRFTSALASAREDIRNEFAGFGFYELFRQSLEPPIPLIDFAECCLVAGSLAKYKPADEIQEDCIRYFYGRLLDMFEYVEGPTPEFLHAFRNLLKSYDNFNEICPLTSNEIGARSILACIKKFIDNQNPKEWFLESVKYLHYYFSWRFDSSFFNPNQIGEVYSIVVKIAQTLYLKESAEIAVEILILLVDIDVNMFIQYKYYAFVSELFVVSTFRLKKKLSAVLASAFYRSSNDQMLSMVQHPNIFDVIFDILPNLSPKDTYLPVIVQGIGRFIDFCGLSLEGMNAFKRLVIDNADFENWARTTAENTDFTEEDLHTKELLLALVSLIQRKIVEYNQAISSS